MHLDVKLHSQFHFPLQGSTSSVETGPSYAYSGLFYQYTEASSPRIFGDVFTLESDWLYDGKFLVHLSWTIVDCDVKQPIQLTSPHLTWNRWTEFNKTWQEARSQCPLPSWFLVHLSGRLKCTIVIRSCLWSVVNFSHFWLPLWNRWTEFNETWQEARSQCPLPSLCFSGRSKKQDGCPCLWLVETFSTSPLKPLKGIQQNLTGSKISMSFTKFVFFGPIRKTRWRP